MIIKSKYNLCLLIILLIAFGCSTGAPDKQPDTGPKVNDFSNVLAAPSFVNFPMTIVETKEVDDYMEYTTKAKFKTSTFGLKISLIKNVTAGFLDGKSVNIFLPEAIKFESMGQSSDRLLNFMAIAYKSNLKNMVMKEKQVFTCANLNTEDLDYEKGKGKFKIFLESEDGSEAAELFVNFNFKSNEIWLSEKDMDYREPLLKLLSI